MVGLHNIYLPQNLINEDYQYDLLENGHINVYTNETCSGWVMTEQYYFRYEVMPEHDYEFITICDKPYALGDVNNGTKINTNNGHTLLYSSWFTDNIYYRNDIDKCLLIFLIIFIFGILIPYKIFSRFFGRWLKV